MSTTDFSTQHVDSPSVAAAAPQREFSNTPLEHLINLAQKIISQLDSWFPFSISVKVLALVAALSWYSLVPVRLISVDDTDLGWHLRSGEWIMQHHQVPRTDPFSITGAGKSWVAYSWPFSVLIYEIAKNFDLLGVAAYTLFAWVITITAFFALVRGQGASFWRAILLTLIAGSIFQTVISPRPGTITILLFILLFQVLLRERQRGYTDTVWVIPLVTWIWASVHVQFVYGLFVIGLFCIEPILDWLFLGSAQGPKTTRLWIILAASLVATILNPYGFGPYRVILDFLKQPELAGFVIETRAMSFTMYMDYLVLLLCLGAAFALGRRMPVKPLWAILLLWAAVSAFRMQRDVWLATTIASAVLATFPAKEKPAPRESSRLWIYGAVGVVVVVFAMLLRVPSNKDLLALIARRLPVGAVAYIHEHHLSGPIFNGYDWGGFLIYALPELPVSIDGRTNVHGQDEVGRSLNTWLLHPGWDKDPLLQKANLVIGSPWDPLTNHLKTDTHFKVIFQDRTCVLFQRVSTDVSSPKS